MTFPKLLWFKFFPWLFQAWKWPFHNSMTFPGFPWPYEPWEVSVETHPSTAFLDTPKLMTRPDEKREYSRGLRALHFDWNQTFRFDLLFFCPRSVAPGQRAHYVVFVWDNGERGGLRGASRGRKVGLRFWKIFGVHFREEGRGEQRVTRDGKGVHGPPLSYKRHFKVLAS